jgi:predicted dehydrogenase
MADNGHGPAFRKYKEENEGVALAACCDVDLDRARAFAEKFGFEAVYQDYKKMIEEIRPDAVSLICPVHLTAEIAGEVIKMGTNIIMEKPPGKNREEIEYLIECQRESGVTVRTAFNRRHVPLITALCQEISRTGEKIINVTYQMYRFGRFEPDFSTTAIHAIDTVKFIVGSDYESARIDYDFHPELGEGVKNVFLNAKFENGAYAQLSFVPTGGAVIERISVNTKNHSFFVNVPVWDNIDVPGNLVRVTERTKTQIISGDTLSSGVDMYLLTGFYDENKSFFDYVRAGKIPTCDLESAIQPVEIEDVIRHSKTSYVKV